MFFAKFASCVISDSGTNKGTQHFDETFAILIMTGRYAGTAGEVLHILLYAAGVTIYCFAVNLVIRNKTFFIAMTPVFLMASLLFCHIFLNLELLVPQLKYIAMFLPPSWF